MVDSPNPEANNKAGSWTKIKTVRCKLKNHQTTESREQGIDHAYGKLRRQRGLYTQQK